MTTAGKRMAHAHHAIDTQFAAFARAARSDRIAKFPLEEAIRRLRHHFWVEEVFIFPPLAHSNPGPVLVMLREHGVIWDLLDELDQLLQTDDPDPTMALTIFGALRQHFDAHNETEDAVLYPVADELLGNQLSEPVLNALATEMPTDWRCQMASVKI
ncbi:MAG TPA: hemerythrin domain-containing protein [Propionibacterium sp.]|nr:hemerythrin domain-containing protein [Propionibacterium sp.]